MPQGRSYLVTGGLGFIGAPLVCKLVEAGHRVRVLDNGFRGSGTGLNDVKDSVEIMIGDIRDPAVVDKAVQGVDSVCHLAFVNGTQYFYDRPAYVLDVGVKGIVHVLDSCIRRGVHDLILASSSEVYQTPPSFPTDEATGLSIPDPLNPRYSYAGGKIISELMALNYGRQYFNRVVVFRPHNVFGPNMGWEHVIPQFTCRMARLKSPDGGPIDFEIQGAGDESRSFVYIDDFTEGLIRVIESGKHMNIYHIGTMEEQTISGLARQIATLLGLDIKIISGAKASGGTARRCPSIKKIAALGFSPHWRFEDALQLTVDWYRDHVNEYSPRSLESASLFISNLK